MIYCILWNFVQKFTPKKSKLPPRLSRCWRLLKMPVQDVMIATPDIISRLNAKSSPPTCRTNQNLINPQATEKKCPAYRQRASNKNPNVCRKKKKIVAKIRQCGQRIFSCVPRHANNIDHFPQKFSFFWIVRDGLVLVWEEQVRERERPKNRSKRKTIHPNTSNWCWSASPPACLSVGIGLRKSLPRTPSRIKYTHTHTDTVSLSRRGWIWGVSVTSGKFPPTVAQQKKKHPQKQSAALACALFGLSPPFDWRGNENFFPRWHTNTPSH